MTSMYNSLKDKSQKQVLLVRIWFHLLHQMRASVRTEVFILLQRNIKAKTGLEEAVVNQVTVWPESGADRAAASFKQEFSPVFYDIRGFQENRKLFCLIIMKDPFPKHQRNIFSFDRKKSRTSENSWPFPIKFSFCPINHTARHSLAQQAYYPLNADKFCTWRQSSV